MVDITVRAQYVVRLAPERAVVRLRVSYDRPTRREAYDAALGTAGLVSETISALHDADRGPVTTWSMDQVRTWSERPWDEQGRQVALVHHAQAAVQVEFSDVEALGDWLASVAATDGVAVDEVEWTLTDATRHDLETRARTTAVHAARDKAQHYADALDLGVVAVRAVADEGLLGTTEPPGQARFAMAAAGGGAETHLVPQEIEVWAVVEARFEV